MKVVFKDFPESPAIFRSFHSISIEFKSLWRDHSKGHIFQPAAGVLRSGMLLILYFSDDPDASGNCRTRCALKSEVSHCLGCVSQEQAAYCHFGAAYCNFMVRQVRQPRSKAQVSAQCYDVKNISGLSHCNAGMISLIKSQFMPKLILGHSDNSSRKSQKIIWRTAGLSSLGSGHWLAVFSTLPPSHESHLCPVSY